MNFLWRIRFLKYFVFRCSYVEIPLAFQESLLSRHIRFDDELDEKQPRIDVEASLSVVHLLSDNLFILGVSKKIKFFNIKFLKYSSLYLASLLDPVRKKEIFSDLVKWHIEIPEYFHLYRVESRIFTSNQHTAEHNRTDIIHEFDFGLYSWVFIVEKQKDAPNIRCKNNKLYQCNPIQPHEQHIIYHPFPSDRHENRNQQWS